MKIAVIGATGFVGTHLVTELANRGHHVTAIARNTTKLSSKPNVIKVNGDINDTQQLTGTLKHHDAVISTFNPGWTNPDIYNDFIKGAKAIEKAVTDSGVKRFLVVGGAGSLYINETTQLVDTDAFPKEIKAGAEAARDYLNQIKQNNNLDWTFFSPAIEMHQGTAGVRTGQYRTGLENPVFNDANRSVLSVEDVAVVLADELEQPRHIRQRFTAAY